MTQIIAEVFDAQLNNKYKLRLTSAKVRIEKLNKLKSVVKESEEEIYTALNADLRKSRFEVAITELFFVYSEIDFTIKNLRKWMKPHPIGKNVLHFFARNRLYYEPKGVCLIISPWNYPFQLTINPLISAIAAGNCAILKPSEFSSATSAVIAKIVSKAFDSNEVACFEGDESVSKALLKLPFEHIFFTGSTAVGKKVMEAAARHLSSVTLELGGKSPVIIDETANVKKAAEKVAWGKLINAGQTCIAPDYVLIHESKLEEFVAFYKSAAINMFFDENNKIDHSLYARVINQRHYDRLRDLIVDAVQKGAKLVWGGEAVLSNQTIYPTLLAWPTDDCKIMQEEIFGPILPVITYSNLESAIAITNRKSKPLAMYIFSESGANIKRLLKSTSSGGVCINDVLIHFSNSKLPFGGVNDSGTGSCHGFFGFKSFSHERAVVFQSTMNLSSIVYPPYNGKGWVLKMLRRLM